MYAASICYYLFLSSIQMAWLFLYVVSRLQLPPDAWELLFALFVPETFYPVLDALLDAARDRHPALVPFAVLTAIWSASKAISALWDGLNCEVNRSIDGIGLRKRILASFYYVLLLCAILVGLISSILGKQLLRLMPGLLPFLENHWVRYGWSLLLLCCFFTSIYYFLPKEHIAFSYCLISGTITALGWSVLTAASSLFYHHLFRYYDFGLLVLFGLWLYDCLLLLLYGRLAAKILYVLKC